MIEVVEEQKEQGDKQHYIPHHAVIKSENNTTKLRVVYDASTKTKKSKRSLNECLHIGPVILDCIYGLLMRFRTKTIGLQPKERFHKIPEAGRYQFASNADQYHQKLLHKSRIWYNIQITPFGSYNKLLSGKRKLNRRM